MSASPSLQDAISDRDADQLRNQILSSEFVLLSVSEDGDDDSEEGDVGALTAEIGDFDVLVAFTSEQKAGNFVSEMGELFGDDEGVDGVVVDGKALLDHLPEGLGLLLDPENDDASVIDPSLAKDIIGESQSEA